MSGTGKRSTWPIWLLGASAFVAIWSGWVGLGQLCGFGMVQPLPGIWDSLTLDTSITLPIGMEVYAAYALRIWLSADCHPDAVAFARRSTKVALAVGAAGQVVYHLLTAAGVTAAPWPVTAAVAVLPVAVLGMGAALAHLVAQPYTPPTDAERVVTEVDRPATPTKQAASPAPASEPRRVAGSRGKGKPSATGGTTATTRRPRAASEAGGETADRVAELLAADPHLTAAAIADRLGCSTRTARRHRSAVLHQGSSPAPAGPDASHVDGATRQHDEPATAGAEASAASGRDTTDDTTDTTNDSTSEDAAEGGSEGVAA